MNACPYLVVLFCLVGFGISQPSPSTTQNPECPGMHKIANSLQRGIKTYTKENTICKVNSACTGLMCNGTHKQNDFYMKMELNHCKTPPAIHLDLIYKKINFHKEITKGLIKIRNDNPLFLKLSLSRKRNMITTGLTVQICATKYNFKICKNVATLLPSTTFCLNMKSCPGYNSTGDVPCHLTPTPNSSGPMYLKTTPESVRTTKVSRSTSTPRPNFTIYSVTTELPGKNKARRGPGHHHISIGVGVGIGFACLVAILVVVGAIIYWKKFYRRARLRAAYYNDISMNDPLYEDFGPEVA